MPCSSVDTDQRFSGTSFRTHWKDAGKKIEAVDSSETSVPVYQTARHRSQKTLGIS